MNTITDRRIVPHGALVSALRGCALGQPIVVFGGGPSAPGDWAAVEHLRPLVVGANGHAARLGVRPHYIVCKDDRHTNTKERMEDVLRPIGAPIIGPHWWADYRMAKWPMQGNSGQVAIGVAAFMGGVPIIPIGFDCYQGPTYFHSDMPDNPSHGRKLALWSSTISRLALRLPGACIRPLRGPLTQAFRRYDPAERFLEPAIPERFDILRSQVPHHVKVIQPGLGPPVDWVYAMTAEERAQSTRLGWTVDFSLTP